MQSTNGGATAGLGNMPPVLDKTVFAISMMSICWDRGGVLAK